MSQFDDRMRNFKSRPVVRTLLCVAVMAAAVTAFSQSAPIEVGSPLYSPFQIPTLNGSLRYSLSVSDQVTLGYSANNELANSASFSGNVGYLSASVVHPFDLLYSGGYLAETTGQPSSFFENLSLTQSYNTKAWRFTLRDQVHYLPAAPSAGLSGVPGVGDVGVAGATISEDVLTPYATRVENDSSFDVSRVLTGSTSITGTGYYSVQRFLGNSGLETNDLTARGSVYHRVDARSSISADYSYTDFSYVSQSGTFSSQSVLVELTHQMTRRLNLGGGIGPERIDSSSLNGVPPSYTYSARAHATYVGSLEHGVTYGLQYTRETNSGSGVTLGGESDNIGGNASRRFTRSLQGSIEAHYNQTAGVQLHTTQQLKTQSAVVSAQASRAISRTLSVFCSYSLQHQTYSGTYQSLSPLHGLMQVLGFGLTYSPSQIHLGRQQ